MELSPETCRVKPLRRINAIVASCWNYFTMIIQLTQHSLYTRTVPTFLNWYYEFKHMQLMYQIQMHHICGKWRKIPQWQNIKLEARWEKYSNVLRHYTEWYFNGINYHCTNISLDFNDLWNVANIDHSSHITHQRNARISIFRVNSPKI